MTHNINVILALRNSIHNLNQYGVKSHEKWEIHRDELPRHIVDLTLKKAEYSALQGLCAQPIIQGNVEAEERKETEEIQRELQETLEKVRHKIEDVELIINFIKSNSQDVDPRVAKLSGKIEQLAKIGDNLSYQEIDKIRKKIDKHTKHLDSVLPNDWHYDRQPNEKTSQVAQNIQQTLEELTTQLLLKEPVSRSIDGVPEHLRRNTYTDRRGIKEEHIEQCMKLGNVAVDLEYLTKALQKDPQRQELWYTYTGGHNAAARHFSKCLSEEGNLPDSLNFDDLMDGTLAYVHNHDRETSLSFAATASKEEICEQLEHVQNLMAEGKLKAIGTHLTIDDIHWVVTLHANGRVSLFNTLGDPKNGGMPNQKIFGNIDQAVESLHLLLGRAAEAKIERAGMQVTLTMYCLRQEMQARVQEKMHKTMNSAMEKKSAADYIHDMQRPYFYDEDFPPFPDEKIDETIEKSNENAFMQMVQEHGVDLGALDFYTGPTVPLLLKDITPYHAALQDIISFLSRLNDEGYFEAVPIITELCEEKELCMTPFPLSGTEEPKIIGARFFFHTWKILSVERPAAVNPNDHDFGANAFQLPENEGGATPLEKLRAVQRTQVECLLRTLRIAFEHKDQLIIEQALAMFEEMKMDAKDCPNGIHPVYSLFGNMYLAYQAAWEADKKMPNLHTLSDFGRKAFLDAEVCDLVNADYKLQALEKLTQAIKETWKL